MREAKDQGEVFCTYIYSSYIRKRRAAELYDRIESVVGFERGTVGGSVRFWECQEWGAGSGMVSIIFQILRADVWSCIQLCGRGLWKEASGRCRCRCPCLSVSGYLPACPPACLSVSQSVLSVCVVCLAGCCMDIYKSYHCTIPMILIIFLVPTASGYIPFYHMFCCTSVSNHEAKPPNPLLTSVTCLLLLCLVSCSRVQALFRTCSFVFRSSRVNPTNQPAKRAGWQVSSLEASPNRTSRLLAACPPCYS